MSENKDELIKAQNELIGVLFEIIKRLQSNNDLDTEYFKLSEKIHVQMKIHHDYQKLLKNEKKTQKLFLDYYNK